MPKPNASPKMDRLVVPHDPSEDAAVRAAICETLYAKDDIDLQSRRTPESTSAIAGEMRASLWRSVLASFVEGFGAYGMAFCPTGYVSHRAIAMAGEPSPQRVRMDEDVLQTTGGSGESGRLSWPRRALAFMAGAVADRAAHWRRERDIQRAVAALDQLDDRMLRDMGIPGRTGIEQVVRYCHDC
jgi:uncharacterized protein YjiS (DUF1127 family)